MRRMIWLAPFALVAGAALIALLKPAASPAENPAATPDESPSHVVPQLPIGQVVLFSSGVGYFQREGIVEGNSRVDLTFPVTDVNDLLKSMVVRDLDGGHVSTVSYDGSAPIEKTLKSFAVNLTNNPDFDEILAQARGEKVEVVLQPNNSTQSGPITGNIVGIEKQKQVVGKDQTVDVEFLNLWCAEGLRAVKLSEVQRVRFLNPVLDSEFKKALETLALSHDTQKKSVCINFVGEGKRRVRVGYVVENPIWKTSYRLVLGKGREDKPYLQGWAVVENPTDEDWKDVRMALVSGRPISFKMDLYQPLNIPRPTVTPELFASLQPQTYNGAVGMIQYAPAGQPLGAAAATPLAAGATAPPPAPAPPSRMSPTDPASSWGRQDNLDLQRGVASAASAAKLGDFFQYRIEHPVHLPRQKSALLPIVARNVGGTRVSIYNESVQSRFPLLGLKFKNTTGLHLMQGPITLFENNSYAGDARIQDLQPGEERLLSYAIDLGTEVETNPAGPAAGGTRPVCCYKPNQLAQAPCPPPTPDSDWSRLIKIQLQKGVLVSTLKDRQVKKYRATNRSDQERLLIVEHPYRPEYKLVSRPRPSERTSDFYRFEVHVPAGKSAGLEVVEERAVQTSVHLANIDEATLRQFLQSRVCSSAVRAALEKAAKLREKLAGTQRETAEVNKQLQGITEDQARLRANLKEMPATAAAYKRYLNKFDTQETQIEKLQAALKKLAEVEAAQRTAYENYVCNLDVE